MAKFGWHLADVGKVFDFFITASIRQSDTLPPVLSSFGAVRKQSDEAIFFFVPERSFINYCLYYRSIRPTVWLDFQSLVGGFPEIEALEYCSPLGFQRRRRWESSHIAFHKDNDKHINYPSVIRSNRSHTGDWSMCVAGMLNLREITCDAAWGDINTFLTWYRTFFQLLNRTDFNSIRRCTESSLL